MLVRVTFTSKQQKIIWQCRSLIALIRRNIEVSWASPALVEASGTIELKEMESVIGELFEMSGVSRGEGQARAVRSPSNLCILIFFIHVLVFVSELALFRLEPCPLVLSGSPLFTQGCILICATCLSICMSLRLVGRQHCRLSICSNFGWVWQNLRWAGLSICHQHCH